MPKRSRKKAAPRIEEPALPLARDIEQIVHAMSRVKDPMMRYMLTLFVDLASERIAQLDGHSAVPALDAGVSTTTKH